MENKYVCKRVWLNLEVCLCIPTCTRTGVHRWLSEQGSRQYTITQPIRYSMHACARSWVQTPSRARRRWLLRGWAAGSKWAGNRQINASREGVGVDAGGWRGQARWLHGLAQLLIYPAGLWLKTNRTRITAERLEPQGMWLAVHRRAEQHLGVSLNPGQGAAAPHVAILPIVHFMAYFNHLIKLHSSAFHWK